MRPCFLAFLVHKRIMERLQPAREKSPAEEGVEDEEMRKEEL